MAEAYTSFGGRLITLSDEPIKDFVTEVGLVRDLYEPETPGAHKLAEHVEDLTEISGDFFNRMCDSTADVGSSNFWEVMIGLSVKSKEQGRKFLDTYGYTRLNRFLRVEFGSDETETTIVLRGIAKEVLADKVTNASPTEIKHFFAINLPSQINDVIFSAIDSDTAHPALVKHIERLEDLDDPSTDPALARVVSTLLFRRNGLIVDIPIEVRAKLLTQNKHVFVDYGMTTKGAKLKIIDWLVDDTAEDDTEAPSSTEAEDTDIVDSDDIPKIKQASFDTTKASCYTEKAVDTTNELHLAIVKSVVNMMFPSRGEEVKEAKAMCKDCAVKGPCLEFAIRNNIKHGIWGGESERARRKIRKKLILDAEE